MPSDSEFDNMEKYVIVMRPLVEITEAIWCRTVGHHRSLLHKLLHTYAFSGMAKSTDSKIESTLKNTIHSDLQNQYVNDALVAISYKSSFSGSTVQNAGFL